jgi:hypothetical protein
MGWIGLVGSCEHGNEPSGSIKCWEVLQWLHNWRLLKKGSAPWMSEWVFINYIEFNQSTPFPPPPLLCHRRALWQMEKSIFRLWRIYMFSTSLSMKKCFNALSVCVCARPSLVPERSGELYSHLIFWSLSSIGWCPVNMNIYAPFTGAPPNISTFSKTPLAIFITFQ